MPIGCLIPPAMAAMSHGLLIPAIAFALSLAAGIACVARGGYGASTLAGLPLAFCTYWLLAAVVLRTEIPPVGYAQIAGIQDGEFRRIVASRMHGGHLTYGDVYEAKAQYDRTVGERARRSLAAPVA